MSKIDPNQWENTKLVKTVTSVFRSDYRIKGSKFLGYLCPATDTDEAEEHIQSVKEEHPTATHHCYAFLLNPNEPVEFSTDDGEPGGTAGLPILNALKSAGLMNVMLVVVRYFGGTKLGKTGLIDAYQNTAQKAIESADLKKLIPIKIYRINYEYARQSIIDKLKNDFGWIELDSTYLESVELTIGCPKERVEQFELKMASKKHLFNSVETIEESFHVKK